MYSTEILKKKLYKKKLTMLTVCCSIPLLIPPTGKGRGSVSVGNPDGGCAPNSGGLNCPPGW